VKKRREARTHGKLCAFVFVEFRHVFDRHTRFPRQERDDSLLIGLPVLPGEHRGVCNLE